MSFVYALCAWDGRVKIGFSATPKRRIAAIKSINSQQISELMVVPGSRQHEKFLHQLLSAYHIKGEWFVACEEVMTAIERVKSGDWLGFVVRQKPQRSEWSIKAEKAARAVSNCEAFLDLPPRTDLTIWKFLYRPTEPLTGEYESLLREMIGKIGLVRQQLAALEEWASDELANSRDATPSLGMLDKIAEMRRKLNARVVASSEDQASTLAAELENCLANHRNKEP